MRKIGVMILAGRRFRDADRKNRSNGKQCRSIVVTSLRYQSVAMSEILSVLRTDYGFFTN